MPVQRVPRYELLLRDLIKQTAVTHPDYNDLNAALEKVKSIATVVDASVASRKRTEKLFQIEKMFVTSPRVWLMTFICHCSLLVLPHMSFFSAAYSRSRVHQRRHIGQSLP
jgi:hypothetical protein